MRFWADAWNRTDLGKNQSIRKSIDCHNSDTVPRNICFCLLPVAIVFSLSGVPVYLAFAFGGIALATAPAPALSIVQEFHTHGAVTDTLLPMAVLDDIVGIAVFFTVNSFIARAVSGGSVPLYMIPVMIFLPIIIGIATGWIAGLFLKKNPGKAGTLIILLLGITATAAIGLFCNTTVFTNITLNYMLMGVSFSAVFSNMIPEKQLQNLVDWFHPILVAPFRSISGLHRNYMLRPGCLRARTCSHRERNHRSCSRHQ